MSSTPGYLVNTGDFAADSVQVRRELSQLPKCMRGIVSQLRFAYNQRQLLDTINVAVDELAHADRAYVTVHRETGPSHQVLPADRRCEYLRMLANRPGFLRGLRHQSRKILRSENVQRQAFPGKGLQLLERVPETGPLAVRGLTRFNSIESIFECMNVGVAAAVSNWIIDQSAGSITEDIGLDNEGEPAVRILAWHCGIAGILALVLDMLKPLDRRFEVTEVDVYRDLRDRQDSAWWTGNHGVDPTDGEKITPVVARYHEVPTLKVDFIVLDMPAPSDESGRNIRNTWKTQEERRLRDPGRLSIKMWRKELRACLDRLPILLAGEGQALLVLPLGVRQARGYQPYESLLAGTEDYLTRLGFEVLRDLLVQEEHPVAQPFVGTARPQRRLLIVRRRVT